MALRQRVQPSDQEVSVREKDVRFALIDTPNSLDSFHPSRAGISGVIHPGQDMADWIIS